MTTTVLCEQELTYHTLKDDNNNNNNKGDSSKVSAAPNLYDSHLEIARQRRSIVWEPDG